MPISRGEQGVLPGDGAVRERESVLSSGTGKGEPESPGCARVHGDILSSSTRRRADTVGTRETLCERSTTR